MKNLILIMSMLLVPSAYSGITQSSHTIKKISVSESGDTIYIKSMTGKIFNSYIEYYTTMPGRYLIDKSLKSKSKICIKYYTPPDNMGDNGDLISVKEGACKP